MKVALTADDGYVYQGLSLETNKKYEFSFWAKGENLENETPFALVLDRQVPSAGGDEESYQVPDYQYYVGYNTVTENWTDEVKSTQQFKLTNQWKKYTCIIDNTFPLKDGLETANANTIPRLPFAYFKVANAAVGTTYCIDDVAIATPGTYGYPQVTDVSVSGNVLPKEQLSLTYNYYSPDGAQEGQTTARLVTVYNGHDVSLGVFDKGETITIAESAIGKQLFLEVFPINQNVVSGSKVRIPLTMENYGMITFGDTSSVRLYSDTEKSAAIVYASYKGNELMDVKISQNVPIAKNTAYEIAVPAELKVTGADKICAYVWSDMTNVTPYIAPIPLS